MSIQLEDTLSGFDSQKSYIYSPVSYIKIQGQSAALLSFPMSEGVPFVKGLFLFFHFQIVHLYLQVKGQNRQKYFWFFEMFRILIP